MSVQTAPFLKALLELPVRNRAIGIAVLSLIIAFVADWSFGFENSYTAELLTVVAALALAIPALSLNEAARSRKRLALAIAKERSQIHDAMESNELAAVDAEVGRLIRQHLASRDAALEWNMSSEFLLYLGYAFVLASTLGKLLLA